jgi:hypothetical protein
MTKGIFSLLKDKLYADIHSIMGPVSAVSRVYPIIHEMATIVEHLRALTIVCSTDSNGSFETSKFVSRRFIVPPAFHQRNIIKVVRI